MARYVNCDIGERISPVKRKKLLLPVMIVRVPCTLGCVMLYVRGHPCAPVLDLHACTLHAGFVCAMSNESYNCAPNDMSPLDKEI